MAEITPPAWVEQSGNHARQGRLLSTAGTVAGVWTNADLAVSNPSGLNISVAAGGCYVMATSTAQGGFACYNDAAKAPSGSLPSAPASTQVSLIVAKVHAKEFGDGTDDWQLLIVNGTPGGGTPATPSNALLLATATVNAGSTSVNSLVDNRVVYGEGGVVRATGMANQVPDIVKAAASQSADLTEWQNSAGTVLSKVDSAGVLYGVTGHFGNYGVAPSAYLSATATSASFVPLAVKGASGQTADLQEWQDSNGNILARVGASGGLAVTGGTTLTPPAANSIPLTVKGFSGQSSALIQAQNSGGTPLWAVGPSGEVYLSTFGAGSATSAIWGGNGAPANGNGGNGDFYFRIDTPGTANQRIYVKSAGVWVGIV